MPTTTILLRGGPMTEVPDPHAVPFPQGELWDELGHELACGREPEAVAREYGEDPGEVEHLSRLFWDGYSRSAWLAEAEEYGLLEELLTLVSDELYPRLLQERRSRGEHS